MNAADVPFLLSLDENLRAAIRCVESARLLAIRLQHLPGLDVAARSLLAAQATLVGAELAPLRKQVEHAHAVAAVADDN